MAITLNPRKALQQSQEVAAVRRDLKHPADRARHEGRTVETINVSTGRRKTMSRVIDAFSQRGWELVSTAGTYGMITLVFRDTQAGE